MLGEGLWQLPGTRCKQQKKIWSQIDTKLVQGGVCTKAKLVKMIRNLAIETFERLYLYCNMVNCAGARGSWIMSNLKSNRIFIPSGEVIVK